MSAQAERKIDSVIMMAERIADHFLGSGKTVSFHTRVRSLRAHCATCLGRAPETLMDAVFVRTCENLEVLKF